MKTFALTSIFVLNCLLALAININQSACFDGYGDRIRVTDNNPFNPSANPSAYQITGKSITVEAWVYPMNLPANSDGYVIACRPYWNEEPWRSFELRIDNFWNKNDDPRFQWIISDGAVPGNWGGTLSPNKPVIGTWTHVAGTYDGNYLRLYINGVLVDTQAYNSDIGSGNAGFYIGGHYSQFFKGAIDDVRLWNTVRTQNQIQASMYSVLNGDEAGLAGYWPMDDTYSTAEGFNLSPDKTANHNDLQLQYDAKIFPYPQGTTPELAVSYLNFSTKSLAICGEQLIEKFNYNGWPKPSVSMVLNPDGMYMSDDYLIWTPQNDSTRIAQVKLEATNSSSTFNNTNFIYVDKLETAQNQLTLDQSKIGKTGALGMFGKGLTYKSQNGLFSSEFSLLDRDDNKFAGKLFDYVYSSYYPLNDFSTLTSRFSGFNAFGNVFNDSLENHRIGVEISQSVNYSSTTNQDKYIIVEYTVKNSSGAQINDLFAQMTADFDIGTATNNMGAYIPELKLSYSYEKNQTNNPYYYGFMLLGNEVSGEAIFKANEDSVYIRKTDILSIIQPNPTDSGDYRNQISTGPYSLADGESCQISFAYLAGDDLNDLMNSAQQAINSYNAANANFEQSFTEKITETGLATNDNTGEVLDVFDYNMDGFEDIISYSQNSTLIIYRNNGDKTFSDVTSSVNIPTFTKQPASLISMDLDNNGYPDIICFDSYVLNYRPEIFRVFMNYNGIFEEKTEAFGLSNITFSNGNRICAGIVPYDFDRDGDLDFLIANTNWISGSSCNNSKISVIVNEINSPAGQRMDSIMDLINIGSNILPYSIGISDINNDQLLDIVVCEQSGGIQFSGYRADPFVLYKNMGNLIFEKSTTSGLNNASVHNFITVGDYNNDGCLDFINGTSDCCGTRKTILWKNNGNESFSDMSSTFNLTPVSDYYNRISLVDFNNDGFSDISMTSLSGFWSDTRHQLWEFDGNTYVNNAAEYGLQLGFNGGNKGIAENSAWLDYDNDGDLDFYNYDWNDSPNNVQHFMENNSNPASHYLNVKLVGSESPKDGIGSRVVLKANNKIFTQFNNGYIGNSFSNIFHFGLGTIATVDTLFVYWPSGKITIKTNINVNALLEIKENENIDIPVGLIGFYPFDGNAEDVSNYNNDGQIIGATSTTDRKGIMDGALNFDGIDDYVFVGNNESFNLLTDKISITAWIYVRGSTYDHQIVAGKWYVNGNADRSWILELQPNGNILQMPLSGISSDNYSNAESSEPIEFNKWYFVAGVYDGSSVKLYLNGKLTCNIAASGMLNLSNSNVVLGGHDSESDRNPFNGMMDEIGIWNKALSQQEIQNMCDKEYIRYGDVNGDDKVLAHDAAIVLQYTVDLDPIPDIDPLPWESWRISAADVDGNNSIWAYDASLILQKTVKLIDVFPIEINNPNALLAPKAETSDITVYVENNKLIFKSNGNLSALNVDIEDGFKYLDSPTEFAEGVIKATNIDYQNYKIGIASANPISEGKTVLIIPFRENMSNDLTMHLIINNTPKSVILKVSTQNTNPEITSLKITPNPNFGIFLISGLRSDGTLTLTDISGHIISEQAISPESKIDFSPISSGIYFVKVRSNGLETIHKVVKL